MGRFVVREWPRVEFATPLSTEYLYVTETPSLSLSWLRGGPDVVAWRVKWARLGDLAQVDWKPTGQPLLQTAVDGDGEYDVLVEALDASRNTVARSGPRTIRVAEKPKLPPPLFAAHVPDRLEADRKGDAKIDWLQVPGAVEYLLVLKNADGQTVQSLPSVAPVTSLRRLRPGAYRLSVYAVDSHRRRGPASVERELTVPKTSAIEAPKLRTIQVK
jgi:hypothetical protein